MTLTTKRKSEIISERVNRMLDRIPVRAKAINQDGGLPGDLLLPGPDRLDRYMLFIKTPRDIMLLVDGKESEDLIRKGVFAPPDSPYLLNLLRIPGEFAEVAGDWMALNARYPNRYAGGADEVAPGSQQSSLPAGRGVPVPQASAFGPAQPPAGGGYGGAGAP